MSGDLRHVDVPDLLREWADAQPPEPSPALAQLLVPSTAARSRARAARRTGRTVKVALVVTGLTITSAAAVVLTQAALNGPRPERIVPPAGSSIEETVPSAQPSQAPTPSAEPRAEASSASPAPPSSTRTAARTSQPSPVPTGRRETPEPSRSSGPSEPAVDRSVEPSGDATPEVDSADSTDGGAP